MDYNETLKYIGSAPKFLKTPGNGGLIKLLEYLGNPQDSLSFIHVAGTNGKGSVCAMTSAVLRDCGYKTGLYTSPFINVFNERIQINGENIPDEKLAELATCVKSAIDCMELEISEFARITAIAFLYFKSEECDYVVLETGLGGRLDATNVIKTPKVCVITKIGLDHTEYLGDTAQKIAAEKCGIIKKGIPVVTGDFQEKSVVAVITEYCKTAGSRLITAPSECEFKTNLKGSYQKSNASVAAEVCRLLKIPEKNIKNGLLNVSWPARFEFLRPNLILDGAHNPDGISALIKSLKELDKNIIIVTAMMRDKGYRECAEMLGSIAKQVFVTELPMPRCIPGAEFCSYFDNAHFEPDCIKAVSNALSSAGDNDIVCVCGSLYLAGAVRKSFI